MEKARVKHGNKKKYLREKREGVWREKRRSVRNVWRGGSNRRPYK
jgi:hypothetical protein